MPPPPVIPPPPPPVPWPVPRFSIRVDDLAHEGSKIFFKAVDPLTVMHDAVLSSFENLYSTATVPKNVESITLILQSMPGVAYTTGSKAKKEIFFSLEYIKSSASRATDEIRGVLTHEVVHCYQHDANGTCPGGLIEGIADFVRLRANLAPPHWKQRAEGKWDAGYETTAYFLAWLDGRFGVGKVVELNMRLRDQKYNCRIFKDITGKTVKKLWKSYCLSLEGKIEEEVTEEEEICSCCISIIKSI